MKPNQQLIAALRMIVTTVETVGVPAVDTNRYPKVDIDYYTDPTFREPEIQNPLEDDIYTLRARKALKMERFFNQ